MGQGQRLTVRGWQLAVSGCQFAVGQLRVGFWNRHESLKQAPELGLHETSATYGTNE
jgi:hypothetical protein